MYLLLIPSCIVASLLLIWFRTEGYVEYCKAFKLDKISFYKDFYAKQAEDARLTYLGYLKQYHNSFFVRLITCPICLGAWISTFAALGFATWWVGWSSFILGVIIFAVADRLLG